MKEKLTERFLTPIIPQKRPYEVVVIEINGLFILYVQPLECALIINFTELLMGLKALWFEKAECNCSYSKK